MEDGIRYFHCNRYGCGKLVGAQRFEDGKVVEQEFIPSAAEDEEGHLYCSQDCKERKDEFVEVEEMAE